MPIEIRELVIKASVDNKNIQSGGNAAAGNSEAIINEVLERVFRIMEQKSER
ncbi:DUF5908 family protein [Autumnicola psychrophila]|uniref:DUF5908 family protein n=1 Tax=Autumnicola psychrophila TaxID=3075592 RepID=A0ABU3DTG5_9FLAO|nr:DUF5908 family protein [Zunongwangia sp. F225]MDT0687003.1 DUF5908 family protein [Zunongwangia sp. F225]